MLGGMCVLLFVMNKGVYLDWRGFRVVNRRKRQVREEGMRDRKPRALNAGPQN